MNPAAQFIIGASNELIAAYEEGRRQKELVGEKRTRGEIEWVRYMPARKWTGYKGDFP